MLNARTISSVTLILSLTTPLFANAATLRDITREKITSRRIYESAKYTHNLERLEYLWGKVRKRPTVRKRTSTNVWLRKPSTRYVKRGTTPSGLFNRMKYYRSPKLPKTGISVISKSPVSLETEAAYRNGIKYFRGQGVRKDNAFAFMWLQFALADGHPMARSALLQVSRRMTRPELEIARERTKRMTRRPFLNLENHIQKTAAIRDETRQKDLEKILAMLGEYWGNNEGAYPDNIPQDLEVEICKYNAVTCVDRLDFRMLVPNYMLNIPNDPFEPVDTNGTGYFVIKDKEGVLTLFSKYSEFEFALVKSELRE